MTDNPTLKKLTDEQMQQLKDLLVAELRAARRDQGTDTSDEEQQ